MRLWADFNDVHDDNRIESTLEFAESPPLVTISGHPTAQTDPHEPLSGEWVLLFDHEENMCKAKVLRVDRPRVYLEIDWSTWLAGDRLKGPRISGITGSTSSFR